MHAEHCIVEIVDDEGSPCAPGRSGRLLVTALRNFAMPLLRYDTGDTALLGEPCPCGRGLPVIRDILDWTGGEAHMWEPAVGSGGDSVTREPHRQQEEDGRPPDPAG